MRKYIIKNEDLIYTKIDSLFDYLYECYDCSTDCFDEYLDDEYSKVEICGCDIWPSRILYELERDTYYEAFEDYKSNLWNDNVYDYRDKIEYGDDGDEIYIDDVDKTIEVIEEYYDPMIDEGKIIITEGMSISEIEEFLERKGYYKADALKQLIENSKSYKEPINSIYYGHGCYHRNAWNPNAIKEKCIFAAQETVTVEFDV